MAFLSVSNLCKQNNGSFFLNNISFEQKLFQKIAIAGETGSGKTTLLKIIGGLLQSDSGEVFFEGKKVIGPDDQLLPGHLKIAYHSQHFELRNNYTVEEELDYKNMLSVEEAFKIYKVCRIEHLLKRKTNQLSGGERQRIVLARLLISSPRLLLLDEPFSNLDRTHKQIIKTVIQDISNKLRISCIMISHDAADILSWADIIIVMKNGSIVQQDVPEQVYNNPADAYTAGLFGDYNLFDKNFFLVNKEFLEYDMNGKQLLVRPEQIVISKEENDGIHGTVDEVFFCGAYYIVNVIVNGQPVRVFTNKDYFKKADNVFLALAGVYCFV